MQNISDSLLKHLHMCLQPALYLLKCGDWLIGEEVLLHMGWPLIIEIMLQAVYHHLKMLFNNDSWSLQGMELYPRIGKDFDIKVFTNCRFGMMSWAVLAVTYCIKQVDVPTFSLCEFRIT